MKKKVVILGAGFGGLELATILSESLGDTIDIVLIDKSDSFIFGFSKLDVMFGRKTLKAVQHAYSSINKPGLRFIQSEIKSIDPVNRTAITDKETLSADILVIALGADYDLVNTPGAKTGGYEFYSVEGARKVSEILPKFKKGSIVVGVTSAPFKCPPAPSEAALLLHDFFVDCGVRSDIDITLVMPFGIPIPPSPDASRAILSAFAQRKIKFVPNEAVTYFDAASRKITLLEGKNMPCDLFLAVPKHVVPAVVSASGITENGWVPVDPKTLRIKFAGVYAVGDVTSVGTPKAGVFSEGAAKVAAHAIISDIKGGEMPERYKGKGTCYMEFGKHLVGRIDVDFLGGPNPSGSFGSPSMAYTQEKDSFGTSRIARWFGK